MDGLLCGLDPLFFLESKAAAFEGTSHDLVDYLGLGLELHGYRSSQSSPRSVPRSQPGHQPIPGHEKMQGAFKVASFSCIHLEI